MTAVTDTTGMRGLVKWWMWVGVGLVDWAVFIGLATIFQNVSTDPVVTLGFPIAGALLVVLLEWYAWRMWGPRRVARDTDRPSSR